MSQTFQLNATQRDAKGRSANRALRANNQIPAIVYGAHKDPQAITLDGVDVLKATKNETFYTRILTLSVDNKPEKVVVKHVERHPFKAKIHHMDFMRVSAKEKITMNIPIHFEGAEEAPGVREGGVVSHLMSEIEIRCLPDALPEAITVDLSRLELNHSLHLKEVKVPAGVEIIALAHGDETHDLPVASIHLPRQEEEEPAETEAPAEDAEAGEAKEEAAPEANADKEPKAK